MKYRFVATIHQTTKNVRKSDKKIFTLPRRFTRKRCVRHRVRGFSMRSS